MFFVEPCGADQDHGENQRRRMKLQKAAHLSGFAGIIDHVVGRQPELAEPYIEKENRKKTRAVENIFFGGNRPAERGSGDAESRSTIGIVEDPLRKNDVEQAA